MESCLLSGCARWAEEDLIHDVPPPLIAFKVLRVK
jgi:hypothetical protein